MAMWPLGPSIKRRCRLFECSGYSREEERKRSCEAGIQNCRGCLKNRCGAVAVSACHPVLCAAGGRRFVRAIRTNPTQARPRHPAAWSQGRLELREPAPAAELPVITVQLPRGMESIDAHPCRALPGEIDVGVVAVAW